MIGSIAIPAAIRRVPAWAWWLIGAALILGAFYLALDAAMDSAYREGRGDEKAAWEKAEAELLKKAANAASKADKQAAVRDAEHAAEVAEEREKIDDALDEGRSPFDVLFGADGG